MRFERVSEHISRLELPRRFFGKINVPVSTYLVRQGNDFHLVDTGVPESAGFLIKALREATAGRGPQSVLLTHAHHGHAGGLNALQVAWRPEVICHRDEAPFVTGDMTYRQLKAGSFAFWLGRLLMTGSGWAVKLAQVVDGGQSVAGMVVIHLPGHTPGSIAFLHPQDQAVICGDAVMNIGGRLSRAFPFSTQDPQAAHAAIHRLAELDCQLLLPAHGAPIERDVRGTLLRFLARRER